MTCLQVLFPHDQDKSNLQDRVNFYELPQAIELLTSEHRIFGLSQMSNPIVVGQSFVIQATPYLTSSRARKDAHEEFRTSRIIENYHQRMYGQPQNYRLSIERYRRRQGKIAIDSELLFV